MSQFFAESSVFSFKSFGFICEFAVFFFERAYFLQKHFILASNGSDFFFKNDQILIIQYIAEHWLIFPNFLSHSTQLSPELLVLLLKPIAIGAGREMLRQSRDKLDTMREYGCALHC